MFSLVVLLSFSSSLAREAKVSDRGKCQFLNDEPWMFRPTIINLNPSELEYYPFMISIDKCTVSCNNLSPKFCVPNNK